MRPPAPPAPVAPAAALMALRVRRKAFVADGPAVLEDLALSLGAREIVALLGPSGCGKTTLLRIVAGLDRHYSGRLDWAAGTAPRLGMVFQQPLLLPWRTVRQNLALVLPRGAPLGPAEAMLLEVGLGGIADVRPGKLSLGMARRVAIVRALAVEPALLLLDEPFVSLDGAMARRARDLVLAAWRARPMAALLVTHDATEAAALADRVLLLSRHPGRVAGEVVIAAADRRAGAPPEVVAAILRAQATAT